MASEHGSSGSDRKTVYVENTPKRMAARHIGAEDGRCQYQYFGIDARCSNDAVAHTFMEFEGEQQKVEICPEHVRDDIETCSKPGCLADADALYSNGRFVEPRCPEHAQGDHIEVYREIDWRDDEEEQKQVMTDGSGDPVRYRLCRGCGLISPPEELDRHGGICAECFWRRERRAGGGRILVVTTARTVHRTARCPPVRQATRWRLWREEDVLNAQVGGALTNCGRCMSHV